MMQEYDITQIEKEWTVQPDGTEQPDKRAMHRPGVFRRLIERIAAENSRVLGTQPLNCCDLNKSARPGSNE